MSIRVFLLFILILNLGIFLKFAIDVSGFYGGNEFSQKAASHELKGLQNYFRFISEKNEDRLNLGLMSLVDYKGFFSFVSEKKKKKDLFLFKKSLGYRVIASSVLPIGSSTLFYGRFPLFFQLLCSFFFLLISVLCLVMMVVRQLKGVIQS